MIHAILFLDIMQKFILKIIRFFYKFIPERFHPILTYCVIGGFNTAISFSLFTFFWRFFEINYLAATSLTYSVCACFQFFANRKMTFKCTTGNIYTQVIKYLTMLGTNYLVTISVMHFNVAVLALSPYVGMVMATACTATISFLLFKFWIFKHRIQT